MVVYRYSIDLFLDYVWSSLKWNGTHQICNFLVLLPLGTELRNILEDDTQTKI